MGIAERREREKEALRTKIVEAARDILSEQGLDGLSMRAIAERVEYSPGTIYLYFKDKEALIQEVVEEGFERMGEYIRDEITSCGPDANVAEQYAAIGRSYAHFAIENTAYFRVMFELPTVAQMDCPGSGDGTAPMTGERSWDFVVAVVERGIEEGLFALPDGFRGAVVGWGLVHGLTSLYLSGHLRDAVDSPGGFLDLIEEAMQSLYTGWAPRRNSAAPAA